jgi:hypothetical protein
MRKFDDLMQLKAELSRRYLGTAGIYGIGISRAESALTLYVDVGASVDLDRVLPAVRTDAAPFHVVVVPTDLTSSCDGAD